MPSSGSIPACQVRLPYSNIFISRESRIVVFSPLKKITVTKTITEYIIAVDFFEAGSHWVPGLELFLSLDQAGFKLTALLPPLPPTC